jgi:hypothetical protein
MDQPKISAKSLKALYDLYYNKGRLIYDYGSWFTEPGLITLNKQEFTNLINIGFLKQTANQWIGYYVLTNEGKKFIEITYG